MRDTAEFAAIQAHYHDEEGRERRAQRSGVPLIRHIAEGLAILRRLGAGDLAERAFCLHPLVQGDEDLEAHWQQLAPFDGRVVALALEYRARANAYLSQHPPRAPSEIELSPLRAVNAMLIADKVQNRKDFRRYHRDHPRAARLEAYFGAWLSALGVSEERYAELARVALDADVP